MGDLNSGTLTCNVDLKIGRNLTISDAYSVYNGAIDVNGQTLTSFLSIASRLIGPLNGTGTVLLWNPTSIEGNGTFAGTLSGYVRVFGSLPNATVASTPQIRGSAVAGVGTVGNVTVEGDIGYLWPGNNFPYEVYTEGVLHTKSLVLNAPRGATFDLVVGGVSDQVQVTGTVTLSGPLKVNIVSGTLTPGQTFTIIDNDATDAVSGTFSGLPEGSTFDVGTSTCSISYKGGDGNDVVLKVVASPKTWTGAVSALWSNPQNWSPSGTPSVSDSLLFPDGATHGSMTNDLPSGTTVGAMTFQGSGYTLSGNALTLMGDLNSGTLTCNVDLKIGRNLTISDAYSVYNGAIDVNGQTLTSFLSIASKLIGPLNGTGTVVFWSPTSIEGNGTFAGTLSGYVRVFGSLPNATVAGTPQIGSAVSGVGTVGNVTVEGNIGYLSPGNKTPYGGSPQGVLHTKSLVVNANQARFDLVVGGVSDQVRVSGTVTLGGFLSVNIVSGTPTPGQTFTIIDNDATDAVSGTFTGLSEGAIVASGPYRFRISYAGGDGNDVVLATLNDTTAALSQSTGSTRFGEPFTLSTTVATVSGTPTGSVTFTSDGVTIGTAPLQSAVATLSLTTLNAGMHSILSTFLGTGGFGDSVSGSITHVVIRGQTKTNVAATQSSAVYGQTARFMVTTVALAPASGQPTGSVTILADGVPLGTVPMVNGTATFETTAFHPGVKSITATYAGDANFEGSTASAIQQNIAKARTEVDARVRPVLVGETPFITIFVNVVPGSSIVPTGVVSISEGGTGLGSQLLSSGAANVSLSPLPFGDHTLVVSYSGDTDFEESSETIVQSVGAPSLSIHGTRILEGNRGVTTVSLVVSLSTPVSQPVRVSFSTIAGSATEGEDYDRASGTIEFASGELTRAIEIHVIGDTFPEPDEALSVLLSNPANATIETPSAVIVIANDDQVPPRRRPARH
jgi:hypothetical protein